ncbi:hypothetical protein ACU8MT_01340 [Rhizobium leguminosarum]
MPQRENPCALPGSATTFVGIAASGVFKSICSRKETFMRDITNLIDNIYGKLGDGPSDLHAGVYRHDDQIARAEPYLRALWANDAKASGKNGARRSKLPNYSIRKPVRPLL